MNRRTVLFVLGVVLLCHNVNTSPVVIPDASNDTTTEQSVEEVNFFKLTDLISFMSQETLLEVK